MEDKNLFSKFKDRKDLDLGYEDDYENDWYDDFEDYEDDTEAEDYNDGDWDEIIY